MSADNWTICPQCSKTYRSRAAAGKQALNDAYGKVSLEEYQNLQDNFHNVVKEEDDLEETLREDYQQGISQGTYSVFYHASCTACGFDYEYEFEEEIL
jgi:hypothetical protein